MDAALLGHRHAKTAIDVACWDIFGKSVELPVCELLGGSTGDLMPVISSIYAGEPDRLVKSRLCLKLGFSSSTRSKPRSRPA
jgi:L-alanine-DL-glutamate epimerase-like enolase superfamily enzyme